MKYTMKAHPTQYSGVLFRSRLEARWAAFFDLCKIEWQYEPLDLYGWTPDFHIKFPCGHSECPGYHTLFVEVKPYSRAEDFTGHQCMEWEFGCRYNDATSEEQKLGAHGAAGFGVNPNVSNFVIVHGSGGGNFDLSFFYGHLDLDALWKSAGNMVQWRGSASITTFPPPPRPPEYLGGKPPMQWLLAAAKLGKAPVTLGIALWFKYGLQRGAAVPIRIDASLRRAMGLSNSQATRGMHALAAAGLLKTTLGGRGRCAEVILVTDTSNCLPTRHKRGER